MLAASRSPISDGGSGRLSAFLTALQIRGCLELWSIKDFLTGLSFASVSFVMYEDIPNGICSVLAPDTYTTALRGISSSGFHCIGHVITLEAERVD